MLCHEIPTDPTRSCTLQVCGVSRPTVMEVNEEGPGPRGRGLVGAVSMDTHVLPRLSRYMPRSALRIA